MSFESQEGNNIQGRKSVGCPAKRIFGKHVRVSDGEKDRRKEEQPALPSYLKA